MNYKVSIIIPVYCVEMYISRCLDSIVNQTYKNIEIIVVNDGSPDKSEEIIKRYCENDDRIIYIYQENMGLGMARNTGMKISSGDFYFFVDSDDYINPNAIEKLVEGISIEDDIVIGNFVEVDSKGNKYYREHIEYNDINSEIMNTSNFKFEYFFRKAFGINACNKLYNSRFLNDINLKFERNNEIYAEDLLFNLKCYINNPKIRVVNEYTYYYCENINSITKTFKKKLPERFSNLIMNFYEYCFERKCLDNQEDLLSFLLCIAISNSCKNSYDFEENKIITIKNNIKKFKNLTKIEETLSIYSIGDIKDKKWKRFYNVFLFFYKKKLLYICSILQYLRYRFIK